MRTPRFLAAAALLAVAALTAAACGGVKNPEGWAAPNVDGSEAFLFLKRDQLSAVSLQDGPIGIVDWRFPDENRFPDQKDVDLEAVYARPVAEDDAIFLADYAAGVFAVDPTDGSTIWKYDDVEGKIVGDIGVSDSYVSFGTTDRRVYLLNRDDGRPVAGWDGRTFEKGVWAPVLIRDDRVYVATMGGKLLSLPIGDAAAEPQEILDLSGAIADLQFLDADTLFVPSLDKHVYIVSLSGDSPAVSSFATKDWVWTTAAMKDGRAYFGDFGGTFYAVDITGDAPVQAWSVEAGSKVKAAPALIENVGDHGDVLVVADRDAVIHFLRASDGMVLNTVPLPDGSGTVRAAVTAGGDRAYIMTTKGKLFVAIPAELKVVPVGIGGQQ